MISCQHFSKNSLLGSGSYTAHTVLWCKLLLCNLSLNVYKQAEEGSDYFFFFLTWEMWDPSSFSRSLELEDVFNNFDSPLQKTDLPIETENFKISKFQNFFSVLYNKEKALPVCESWMHAPLSPPPRLPIKKHISSKRGDSVYSPLGDATCHILKNESEKSYLLPFFYR